MIYDLKDEWNADEKWQKKIKTVKGTKDAHAPSRN